VVSTVVYVRGRQCVVLQKRMTELGAAESSSASPPNLEGRGQGIGSSHDFLSPGLPYLNLSNLICSPCDALPDWEGKDE